MAGPHYMIFNRKGKDSSVLHSSFLEEGKERVSEVLPCRPVLSPVFSDKITYSPTHVGHFQQ